MLDDAASLLIHVLGDRVFGAMTQQCSD